MGARHAEVIQHGDGVLHRPLLRVGGRGGRYIRRRIAARVIGDAAIAAAEVAHLRFPASGIASKLMNEKNRDAASGRFAEELHPIIGDRIGHRSISLKTDEPYCKTNPGAIAGRVRAIRWG